MSTEVISGVDKVKLQDIISKIQLADNGDTISQFKCVGCNTVALYQYLAYCNHIYCGKCHGKVHGKPCLVEGCDNIVNTAKQDPKLQSGMNKLMTFCSFRKNGCQEKIPLHMFLQHTKSCRYATKNLLPKVYKEDPLVSYKAKNETALNTIRNLLMDLQANQLIIQEKLASSLSEEIKRNCDRIKEDILVDITERVTTKMEELCQSGKKDIEKIQEKIEAKHTVQRNDDKDELQAKFSSLESQCETNIQQKLASLINEEIKINCDCIKNDILENITERVYVKFLQQQQRERKALARIEEVVIRGNEEIERKYMKILQNDKEEMLNLLTNKLEENIQQIEIHLGENFKNETSQMTETIGKELRTREQNMKKEIQKEFQDVNSRLNKTHLEKYSDKQVNRLTMKYPSLSDYPLEEKCTIFEWVIPRIRDIALRLTRGDYHNGYESGIFPIKNTELKMRTVLWFEEEDHWLYICLEFVSNTHNVSPDLIYYHRRKFIILDQSEKETKEDTLVLDEPSFGTEEARKWMIECSGICPLISVNNLENSSSKNNAFVIKIIIEPISVAYKSYISNNGILFWKIGNYKQKKQDYVDGINCNLFSESFYSSKTGYRMGVMLSLAPNHLIVQVCIFKGEYDDNLSPLFPRVTSIFILDQSNSTLVKSLTQNKNTYSVYERPEFTFNYDDIENPDLLKNDCIFIKVVVDPIN